MPRLKRKKVEEIDFSSFDAIKLSIASPQDILKWSYGEVKKAETINYRTFKPERDGLFCEKIFGPTRDWTCSCGKYKYEKHKGVICDRCGVEVTESKVRRVRMGHIELVVPVVHPWFFRKPPSRIAILLGLKITDLEKLIYYAGYIIVDPKNTPLRKGQVISVEEYNEYRRRYGNRFVAGTGAEVIKKLLKELDLDEKAKELRKKLEDKNLPPQFISRIVKHLEIVESFRHSGNKPEWMVLERIPVLPPDLRPLVPIEGGKFASSDLNDFYRRIINRNNRLKNLLSLRAPEVVINNEKRLLQEAVDGLIENGIRGKYFTGSAGRPLKSLSDSLKGKQGRFRQNLLGKRVDYSGRAVIVVGPHLKLDECGIPKDIALELFKPFILRELMKEEDIQTHQMARKEWMRATPRVYDILERLIKDHPVLLNRAPTLHRLSIQAFRPVLVEGKAIQIHPLVCPPFNADFDGDQMAVHLPLTPQARIEALILMLSSNNIFSPANGRPISMPSQDIVMGLAYLTKVKKGVKGEGRLFSSIEEVIYNHQIREIDIHARIKVKGINSLKDENDWTTCGRVIFNQILPEELRFWNKEVSKDNLRELIEEAYKKIGKARTVKLLDDIKEHGFKYATISGLTINIDDMVIPEKKIELIEKAKKMVRRVEEQYKSGVITAVERYNKIIQIWQDVSEQVSEELFETLKKTETEPHLPDKPRFNALFLMADSGARGSRIQVRQLAGMRGLMARPQKRLTGGMGEIVESPVISSFREGLTVLEYFISTHGGRKGLADTALKTADAGYLSRKLIDVSHNVVVTTHDCGTENGIVVTALKDGTNVIESLTERIFGRVALKNITITNPETGEVEIIVKQGEVINYEQAKRIEEAGIEAVPIRSVLTCQERYGVCAKCYGMDLATGKLAKVGLPVGIIAAQSIGEPGTQLTLRTFHVGGIAGTIEEVSEIKIAKDGKISFEDLKYVKDRYNRNVVISRRSKVIFKPKDGPSEVFDLPYGSEIFVTREGEVRKGTVIARWDSRVFPLIAEEEGRIHWEDVVEGITMRKEINRETGIEEKVIIPYQKQKYKPQIVLRKDGKSITYPLPPDTHLVVDDGEEVIAGDILAKIPQEITRIKDITGGLPRVTELFEARRPHKKAVITRISGKVHIKQTEKGEVIVEVVPEFGEPQEYLIPHGKHLMVYEGDYVEAGEALTDGPVDPHDILEVKGEKGVQQHLLSEIQGVYRLQGVSINDKHIEIIIRQMLSIVRVRDAGDSDEVVPKQLVSRWKIEEINEKLVKSKKRPVEWEPVLLGITKAALASESFISAASFQETTRVLTEASVSGAIDYLRGLKENVIIGRPIPAGTGIYKE
ncbi:MAG: DNA-directed RNA polymerase subunit beta' [Caldiserica bacterium]|nr:MAG: DNA-directed RNA polymerase subunit beta' [Caldisericota bacterium]